MKTIITNFTSLVFTLWIVLFSNASFSDNEDFSIKEIPLSSGVTALIPVPNTWKIIFNKKGQTAKLLLQNPTDPISLSFTFIPNKNKVKHSAENRADIVFNMAQRYVSSSVEGKVNLYSIDTTIGKAIFAEFNEKKYKNYKTIPLGEFSSITTGMASHSTVIVSITILSNGTNTPELEMARNIIGGFYIKKA